MREMCLTTDTSKKTNIKMIETEVQKKIIRKKDQNSKIMTKLLYPNGNPNNSLLEIVGDRIKALTKIDKTSSKNISKDMNKIHFLTPLDSRESPKNSKGLIQPPK